METITAKLPDSERVKVEVQSFVSMLFGMGGGGGNVVLDSYF